MPVENVLGFESCVCHHPELVNLYGCEIGEGCKIGAFVEIGLGVKIGRGCKIQSHCFIPPGTEIGDYVFLGPHVTICNCKYPMSGDPFQGVRIRDEAVIGAGAIILPGIEIGTGAIVGAGSVVTKNVEPFKNVKGNPAQ